MAIKINGVDMPSTVSQYGNIQHDVYHLSNNTNEYEIQRTNNFEFVVDTSISQAKSIADSTLTSTVGPNAQEVLRLSVSSAAVPHFTQQPIEVNRGNNSFKFAGVMKFGSGTIRFNDYIGVDTKNILMSWQALSGNTRTQKVGLASDYKKKGHLLQYTPDWQLVRAFVMYGCWVSQLSQDDYTFETNNKKLITATIAYDFALLDDSLTLPFAITNTDTRNYENIGLNQ